MNVNIENYRGYEIIFNTENERFSFEEDSGTWAEKQSYAACKKAIDDYIKLNNSFKPFDVREKSNNTIITIVGIRKDGYFNAINKDGKKIRLTEWDENRYILYEESDNSIYNAVNELKNKIYDLDCQIKELSNKITTPTLKSVKDQYIVK